MAIPMEQMKIYFQLASSATVLRSWKISSEAHKVVASKKAHISPMWAEMSTPVIMSTKSTK